MAARKVWQPIYQRIAEDIRSRIMTGEYQAGQQIPTENEISKQHGVARATVRQGLALLVQEGLIVARRPLGYFVRAIDRLDLPLYSFENDGAADAWVEQMKAQGRAPHQDVRVEIIEPGAKMASRLAISPGGLVVVRRRLRFVDEVPYLIADSYYPEEIVRGSAIAHPADIKAGARFILAELGHKWVTHDDEIEGRHPTEEEVRLLGIPPGLAVLVHTRTSTNGAGMPSRCMVSVFPVDRWRLLYRVKG